MDICWQKSPNYLPRMLGYHARSCPAVTHSPCIVIARPLRRWTMPLFPWSTCVPSMAFNHMSFFGIVLKNHILKEKSGYPQPHAKSLVGVFLMSEAYQYDVWEENRRIIQEHMQKVSIYFTLRSCSGFRGGNDSAPSFLFPYLPACVYFMTLSISRYVYDTLNYRYVRRHSKRSKPEDKARRGIWSTYKQQTDTQVALLFHTVLITAMTLTRSYIHD